ncbi:ABC transporter substrate-binding protein [Candidatus Uhrbacteria bacterium RIFCSPHIGHO2_12_FULL_54_23]|uniref:ABC transporter substrate-binding protein n=1 Tax=Candidatus Uhrbacteria bacterium RIFCSPHIGHO2_12_FULL_54_23 TaxID=1802397 RepID=A0A1F7UJN5_9BACT|nr:MAG: ABC transporter substrate-binding protein [Candidatus Uhrbacteria bacterium RIFCSPHIGHO2_12_FULL_54_23]
MKKIILTAVGALAIAVLAVFSFTRPTPHTPAPETLTVLLDWFPNTNHTGLYVAREKSYFAAQGLEVRILQSEGSSDQIVAAGKADVAVSSEEAVVQARAAGVPIISIAAIIQHNTSAFASLKNADIATVKNFEGKRYGGWGSPIEEAVLTAVMRDANADYGNVKNVTIGTTDFFSTIGREADFQWIFYGWDGVEAARRGIDLNLIWLKDLDSALDYYTPVLIASERAMREQSDKMRRFMAAVTQGYTYAIAHPDESAEILIRAAPELNADLVRASQTWLSPHYQDDAPQWGMQQREVWERYARWLYDHGVIKEMIDTNRAFTNAFLPSP